MNDIASIIKAIGDELTREGKDASEYFPTKIEYVDDEVYVRVRDCGVAKPSWWIGMISPIGDGASVHRASEDDLNELAAWTEL